MRMLNELAEHPLMKKVRGSDMTDDEQVQLSSKASHWVRQSQCMLS